MLGLWVSGSGMLSNELGESQESCFNISMKVGSGNLRIKKSYRELESTPRKARMVFLSTLSLITPDLILSSRNSLIFAAGTA